MAWESSRARTAIETRGRFTVYKDEGYCHRQRAIVFRGAAGPERAGEPPSPSPPLNAAEASACAEGRPPGLVERCDSAFTGRCYESWDSADSSQDSSSQQLEADAQAAQEDVRSLRQQLAALLAHQQHQQEAAAAAAAALAARLHEQQRRAAAAEARCGRLQEQLAQAQAVIGSLAESRGDAFEERFSLRTELRQVHASLERSQRATAHLAEAVDAAREEAAAAADAAREEGRRHAARQWQGRVAELRKQLAEARRRLQQAQEDGGARPAPPPTPHGRLLAATHRSPAAGGAALPEAQGAGEQQASALRKRPYRPPRTAPLPPQQQQLRAAADGGPVSPSPAGRHAGSCDAAPEACAAISVPSSPPDGGHPCYADDAQVQALH